MGHATCNDDDFVNRSLIVFGYYLVSLADIPQTRHRQAAEENKTESSVDVLWDELQTQVRFLFSPICLSQSRNTRT